MAKKKTKRGAKKEKRAELADVVANMDKNGLGELADELIGEPARALRERHRRFVEEYMTNGGNGAEAARVAGFSGTKRALASRASELLARPEVRAAIEKRVKEDPKIADRTARQIWWSEVMRDNSKGMQSRLEASKLLGRSQGDFVEKHEHSFTGQVVVVLPDNGRGDGPAPQQLPPPKEDAP